MAAFLAALAAIPGIAKILDYIAKAWNAIRLSLQKDPVQQQADETKKHDQAASSAQNNDDTSGLFGGQK